ncbi:conserved hypothetical protein [Histoplasma capsulatum H143]|uniref:Uncharacterized protein n=1 Tax=Ajellomyces capsulatus (strain H143) TaxID=544712 RepID=C6HDW2_AJECH|nr:conserved hypothetical protein [Histoplasma capsulatum H143]
MPLHEDGTDSSWACISHSRSQVIDASFPMPSTQPCRESRPSRRSFGEEKPRNRAMLADAVGLNFIRLDPYGPTRVRHKSKRDNMETSSILSHDNIVFITSITGFNEHLHLKSQNMEPLTLPEALITLSQALRRLSPSTVLDSEDLQRDFHQFFLRGAQNQCLKLVPPLFRPTSRQPQEEQSQEQSHKRRRCLNNSPIEAALLVKPFPQPPLPAAQLPKESLPSSLPRADTLKNGHRYTRRQISDANGDTDKQKKSPTSNIERLKAAFIDGPFPISSFQEIWSSTESLIDGDFPNPGRRLYSFMKVIEERITKDFIANRFSLIYATFEVDYRTSKVGSDYGKRKARAFKMVAKDWGCDVKEVKQVEKRGGNYIKLMRDNLTIILELQHEVSVVPTAASVHSLASTTVSQ